VIRYTASMPKKLKFFLRGIGSVFDVSASSSASYSDFIPRQDAEERMRMHWERVGNHISKAMGAFEDEKRAN